MNGPPPSAFPAFDVSKSDRTDALTLVGLTVTYRMRGRDREVLQDVSFRVRRGEAYGLVGESGCGKSTVAMAALRYLPRNGKVKAGKIFDRRRRTCSRSTPMRCATCAPTRFRWSTRTRAAR